MDMDLVREYVKRIELFHGLDPADVAKILAHGITMRCTKGEAVFYKGTVGSQMYVVLGGKVGVVEEGKCLASLTTGDMFGEMALVTKEPRSANVVALEDSLLFVLSESTFERLMTKRVAIRMLFNIIRVLSHRIKEANARLVHSKPE